MQFGIQDHVIYLRLLAEKYEHSHFIVDLTPDTYGAHWSKIRCMLQQNCLAKKGIALSFFNKYCNGNFQIDHGLLSRELHENPPKYICIELCSNQW